MATSQQGIISIAAKARRVAIQNVCIANKRKTMVSLAALNSSWFNAPGWINCAVILRPVGIK